MNELGKIQIFFGKVKSVTDDKKLCRAQIAIPGYTEQLDESMLPWYFPWYGLNYLPMIDDTVPVMVFNDNFVTAFYGNKINLETSGLDSIDDADYENYLEIFKRKVNDKNIQLTYTESEGIEFINDKTKVKQEIDLYTIFVNANTITVSEDKIDIGKEGLEPAVLGDKTCEELHAIIKHQANIISEMYTGFQKIIAGCTTPFTVPIAAQLGPHLATQAKLISENSKIDSKVDKIKSKMVNINK